MRFYLPILLLLFISCRKKENASPLIVITSPASGSVFIPGDTIKLEANISDDGVLSSVTLKLLNAAYTPVDHQESFPINASSYHLTFDYVIQNIYLETGNYFITLSTSDGDNDQNEFRNIVIQGIPKTRKAVYVLSQNDTSHILVNKLDSANQLVQQFDVWGDYSGSAISSRFNELNVAGKITGAINQYDLVGNSLLYTVPVYNAILPSFQSLFFAHELTFVGFYDGRIKAYDNEGQVQFNSDQPVFYQPGVLCVNEKYVFAEAYYAGFGENRLVVINYPSGVAKQELSAGFDISMMISKEANELVIFGNKNGDGKIYQYHVVSNGTNDFHTLFSNIIYSAVVIDNDRYAIATANGLYSYQESNNNLIPIDLSEPAYSLEYDEVNGILYVNAGRKIKEYAFPDAAIQNIIMSADSILDIRIQYNK